VVCFEQLLNLHRERLWYERDLTVNWRTRGEMKKKLESVATILDRVPLSDEDRSQHLPKLFHDLACRLRLAKDIRLLASSAATAHGQKRRLQGYSPAMLVEESRLFQVVTFQTLHLHQCELDQDQVLSAVMVIADEADLQLAQAVRCWGTPVA
jgi:hypothetical protein